MDCLSSKKFPGGPPKSLNTWYSSDMPTGQKRNPRDKYRKVINPDYNRPTGVGDPIRTAVTDALIPLLAEGLGLSPACKLLPPELRIQPSVYISWLTADPQGIGARYAAARDIAYRLMADDLLQIADDSSGDVTVGEDGTVRMNAEFTARSRLKVDTRKWILAKMLPKLYGDRVATTLENADGTPMTVAVMSPEQLLAMATKKLSGPTTTNLISQGDDDAETQSVH